MTWRKRFDEIDLLVQAIPDTCLPGQWRTQRQTETNRLIEQLFAEADELPPAEYDELVAAHEAWHDRKQAEATVELARWLHDTGTTLIAATHPDSLDQMADALDAVGDHRNGGRLRRQAQEARAALMPRTSHAGARPTGSNRPRERRERHVARATSSSDSGDSDPSEPDDDDLARHRRAVSRSILAGETCPMCETPGRVLRWPDGFYCTTCWAGPWLIGGA